MQCVFIIGAARSGTTLLYESLCSAGANKVSYITDQLDYEYWTKLNSPYSWRPTIDRPERPNEGNSFWLKYFPYWKRLIAGDTIMREYFTKEVSHITGDKTFINKNPHHSYRIPALTDIFPEAKFIHLIRDGRAVAYSEYVRRRELKEWDNEPVRELLGYRPDRSDLYNIGLEWSSLVTMARNDGRKLGNKYIEVRYESLELDILKVSTFCNLDITRSNMKIGENEKWKYLSEQEQVDISKSTYELRRELGYV